MLYVPCVLCVVGDKYEHMSESTLLVDNMKDSSYGYPRSKKNLSLVNKTCRQKVIKTSTYKARKTNDQSTSIR